MAHAGAAASGLRSSSIANCSSNTESSSRSSVSCCSLSIVTVHSRIGVEASLPQLRDEVPERPLVARRPVDHHGGYAVGREAHPAVLSLLDSPTLPLHLGDELAG